MHASLALIAALLAAIAPATPAPAPAAKPNPRVTLETSKGKIVIELFPTKAPKTVENFLHYVKTGHYDGTVFHRIIAGFMVQGGGFDTKGVEKPTGAPIHNESNNGVSNVRGTIAMARTGDPHSATAQFFINVVDNSRLDYSATPQRWGYTAFGNVVEGMDVVDAIAAVQTGPGDQPVQPVILQKATLTH
jgi:cyclophilin family peptidyl-prolyl cis-trans isomerase